MNRFAYAFAVTMSLCAIAIIASGTLPTYAALTGSGGGAVIFPAHEVSLGDPQMAIEPMYAAAPAETSLTFDQVVLALLLVITGVAVQKTWGATHQMNTPVPKLRRRK